MGHEHQRSDRNSYLWVNPNLANNVNYQVLSPLKFTNVGPIDYGSIMMYPSSSDMHRLDGTGWYAQRIALSNNDRVGLYYRYQPLQYNTNLDSVIEENISGHTDIYHVTYNTAVTFKKNHNNDPIDLSYNVRVVAYFKVVTADQPNGYITSNYYNFNSLSGGVISWESRTDTYQGYPQPNHQEVSLEKIVVENP